MSKIIKGKLIGRTKTRYVKPSIINDYENIEDKVITLPEIINEDYGYEMHFGTKEATGIKERAYLYTKYTPLYRK
jgi:hypothetical protein